MLLRQNTGGIAPLEPPATAGAVLRFYRFPGLASSACDTLLRRLAATVKPVSPVALDTEFCYYVELAPGVDPETLSARTRAGRTLRWLLAETFEPSMVLQNSSHFGAGAANIVAEGCCGRENKLLARCSEIAARDADPAIISTITEIGPRLSFTSAFSTNAVSICRACGLGEQIVRVERAVRYRVEWESGAMVKAALAQSQRQLEAAVHDRMTQMVYATPLDTFGAPAQPEPTQRVPVMEEGRAALERISDERGLAFDDWDLDFYTKLFRDEMKRNPTDVECFDMAQSNSEHSRHWFFGGRMVIDGEEKGETLFRMVKDTITKAKVAKAGDGAGNSIIAFHDNSSVIRGYPIKRLCPQWNQSLNDASARPAPEGGDASRIGPAPLVESKQDFMHPLLTAETHNFPTGVAPFPGATTGTGGRLRDVQATGTGAHTVAGTAAYCVGNLNIPGHDLPWEDKSFAYPSNLASPLSIIVEASNGASDYGNKFGEPVVAGFSRSFGMRLPSGERREWIKPIMFTAGIGMMDGRHVEKSLPAAGMLVVKVGGPCYRIGIGGGAASSRLSDEKDSSLDFDAVQRGDAEMENKMNRVIRACVELGAQNPILSIHDQGAGGNSNVLKEIAEPAGCKLDLRALLIGDPSLSQLEIWGSEYQENCALLIHGPRGSASEKVFDAIAKRENCPYSILGQVTGDGRVVIQDSKDGSVPVDLDLEKVLGKLPQKTFTDVHEDRSVWLKPISSAGSAASAGETKGNMTLTPGAIPEDLGNVLRLMQVGSKRFLTNKVDRSVTGLVAQQQCVGPLHTPLADVAVLAHSHFPVDENGPVTGTATAVGEQPIKGLIDPAAMARMSVGETLTNLIWARCSAITDVKMSGNWMWAAKLPGEAASMWDACEALRDVMLALGVAIDGGKDSLSMAARAPAPAAAAEGKDGATTETVKCPGALVMSAYVTCPDVSLTVTPDFKLPTGEQGNKVNGGGKTGAILFVDLAAGRARVGGSAFAQCKGELGAISPDLEDPETFVRAWDVMQGLIEEKVLSAGHDRSDGGLITAVLEMCFAGNCGASMTLPAALFSEGISIEHVLFAEELGLVIECGEDHADSVLARFSDANVLCYRVGSSSVEQVCAIEGYMAATSMPELRDLWESTSFALEMLQCNPACVEQERASMRGRMAPPLELSFEVERTKPELLASGMKKPRVAILRDEGSNGDREMASAFHAAGFETWDVHVRDLLSGAVRLDAMDPGDATKGLFRGVVFVGGFSYADTLDSAKGWAGTILFNDDLWGQFRAFYNREDTFSLGVCNGCQLMALLGWIPEGKFLKALEADEERTSSAQPRFVHNESGRFESRFSAVKVVKGTPAEEVWFNGMGGSVLGVWVAHGEGRVFFPDEKASADVATNNLAPLAYVDDQGNPTESYPMNPNGSAGGLTSLCSKDGRHLAMMPHPERCFTAWQQPWTPPLWKGMEAGPWLRMFQNVREWCDKTQ
jgi:phosphoribosylformylglycinamidine synthase